MNNPRVAARDAGVHARITDVHPLVGVRAGSALVRLDGRLLAIQDDAFTAVWIDPATRVTRPLVLLGSGRELDKQSKPDFESAFVHDARVWILGSGALPGRCVLARIDPSRREAVVLNALPLFGVVERALGRRPNIEGAVPLADRLRLFHRGPGRERAANCTIDITLDALSGAVPRVLDVVCFELGQLGATFLAFSDAVALGRKHVAYLAVAEDTPDGIADGAIAGAAVGIIDDAAVRWNMLTEADGSPSLRKVEGVALDEKGGGWLLTDPDDATRPAELCRVTLDF